MSKLRKHIPVSSLVFLSLASLAILLVFAIDLSILDISPFAEGPPDFGIVYLLRTALIVLSSGLFVISVVQLRVLKKDRVPGDRASEIWGNWGLVTWSIDAPTKQDIFSLRVKGLIVWGVLLASLFFLFIFLTHPVFFFRLGSEDKPVETTSVVLHFINCGLFIYISSLLYRRSGKFRILYVILSLSFSVVFFLIGMEEVSWFQRVFSITTPEFFEENIQHEMNLHNFATDKIEDAYYFASFVFLIVLPFFNDRFSLLKKNGLVSFFMPSLFVLFASTVFVAYNYDMWNILFTQLSVFVTLFILAHYTWLYLRLGDNSLVSLAVIISFVLTQTLFLAFGDRFVRPWDVTEYKELFIPLAFLLYSLEILQKAKRVHGSQV